MSCFTRIATKLVDADTIKLAARNQMPPAGATWTQADLPPLNLLVDQDATSRADATVQFDRANCTGTPYVAGDWRQFGWPDPKPEYVIDNINNGLYR